MPTTTHAAAAFLLLLCSFAPLGFAQQKSPFESQGLPPFDLQGRVQVYASCFLERLLSVDDNNYQFEAIFYMRFAWVDSRAWSAVRESTIENLKATTGSGILPCSRPCNVGQVWCCDTLWLPGAVFSNVQSLPQGRTEQEEVTLASTSNHSSVVAWSKRVHGIFYSPMSFRKFPFDKQTLQILVQAEGAGYSYVASSTAYHTSLQDSSGTDLVNGWNVKSLRIIPFSTSASDLLQFASTSNPDDPLPLAESVQLMSECAVTSTYDGAVNILRQSNNSAINDFPRNEEANGSSLDSGVWLIGGQLECAMSVGQSFVVEIEVERLSSYFIYNIIVPMFLMVYLSFLAFAIHPHELTSRLALDVTFFLSLTTLQFVVNAQLPDSSYMTKLHQLMLMSYIAIAVCIFESVIVHFIARADIIAHKQQVQKLAEKVLQVEAQRISLTNSNSSSSSIPGGYDRSKPANDSTSGTEQQQHKFFLPKLPTLQIIGTKHQKVEKLKGAVADLNHQLDQMEDPFFMASLTINIDRTFFILLPITYMLTALLIMCI